MFNRKGQGSLEYLLLIGGAVLVAAIVIGLVVTSSQQAGGTISTNTNNTAACTSYTTWAQCKTASTGTNPKCVPIDQNGIALDATTNTDAPKFSRCSAK